MCQLIDEGMLGWECNCACVRVHTPPRKYKHDLSFTSLRTSLGFVTILEMADQVFVVIGANRYFLIFSFVRNLDFRPL